MIKRLFFTRSKESLVLYIAMFVMGGCGLAYEYTLSKIASDLLGNSTRQWAIIIGVMMFFMGLGADVQKYLSDHRLFDKFIFAEILLGILGGFGPIAMLYTFGTFPSHYVLIQYFFICSIGLLIGFEIPLLTRINQRYMQELRLNLGGILKMDYIGALAGALVWIMVLPKFFTLIESAFVLGIFNITVGGFTLFYFRNLTDRKWMLGLFTIICLAGLIFGFNQTKNWTSYAEQYLYRDKIVFSQTSPYQHIVMTKSRAGDISCYINGHLQFNSFDEFIYHENLVHPAFTIAPVHEKVLVLGGGDGLAVREILKYPDVKSVTVCDIDPLMTDLAKENPYLIELNENSLENSRVTILKNHALIPAGQETLYVASQQYHFQKKVEQTAVVNIINLDAAVFVEQISGVYDVIIIDFPDPNSLELSKLYSEKFYHHVVKKLSAGGIMAQQSTSPIYAKEAFLCIGRTMQVSGLSVVPYHDNIPSFGEWGWWVGGRSEMYSTEMIRQQLDDIDTLAVDTKYLTPELIQSSLVFGKDQLLTIYTDTNTIITNRVYEYYVQGWKHFQ